MVITNEERLVAKVNDLFDNYLSEDGIEELAKLEHGDDVSNATLLEIPCKYWFIDWDTVLEEARNRTRTK